MHLEQYTPAWRERSNFWSSYEDGKPPDLIGRFRLTRPNGSLSRPRVRRQQDTGKLRDSYRIIERLID